MGKMTFYFVYKSEETVENKATPLDDELSFYLTGSFCATYDSEADKMVWPSGLAALEMTRFQQTDYFYVQIDWAYNPSAYPGTEGGYDYQILVGYNKSSGLRSFQEGLIWDDSFKSNSEQELGSANPTYVYEGFSTEQKISLGTHQFDELPNTEIFSYSRTFTISGIQSYNNIYIAGSFDNWVTAFDDDHKLTRGVAEGHTDEFTYDFGNTIEASVIEYKLVVANSATASFYKYVGTYSGTLNANNNPIIPDASPSDTANITTWTFPSQHFDPTTLVNITIKLYIPSLEASYPHYVNSSIDGWENNVHKMDKVENEDAWSYTYVNADPSKTYELGFSYKDGTTFKWFDDSPYGTAEGSHHNFTIDVGTASITFAFEGDSTTGCLPVNLDNTLTLSTNIEIPTYFHMMVTGAFNNYNNREYEMTRVDNTHFSIDLSAVTISATDFQFVISRGAGNPEGAWDPKFVFAERRYTVSCVAIQGTFDATQFPADPTDTYNFTVTLNQLPTDLPEGDTVSMKLGNDNLTWVFYPVTSASGFYMAVVYYLAPGTYHFGFAPMKSDGTQDLTATTNWNGDYSVTIGSANVIYDFNNVTTFAGGLWTYTAR